MASDSDDGYLVRTIEGGVWLEREFKPREKAKAWDYAAEMLGRHKAATVWVIPLPLEVGADGQETASPAS